MNYYRFSCIGIISIGPRQYRGDTFTFEIFEQFVGKFSRSDYVDLKWWFYLNVNQSSAPLPLRGESF